MSTPTTTIIRLMQRVTSGEDTPELWAEIAKVRAERDNERKRFQELIEQMANDPDLRAAVGLPPIAPNKPDAEGQG